MKNKIMVIEREKLFLNDHFEGFKDKSIDYEKRILNNFIWLERDKVENNSNFKQPIPYGVIYNPTLKKLFVYQRRSDAKNNEKRLYGKWSIGFGGHIDFDDSRNENPITAAFKRELNEEIGLDLDRKPKLVGYLNQESGVEEFHFGLVYLIPLNSNVVNLSDELKQGEFKTMIELIEISNKYDMENWSKFLVVPLKQAIKEKL